MRGNCCSIVIGIVVSLSFGWIALPATWAVVIGVAEYKDPAIRDLAYTTADAAEFAQVLIHYCNVDPDRIRLLMNSEATWQNIKKAFYVLSEEASADDTVLVYFSGHGSFIRDRDSDEEDGDGMDEVLLPYDAEMGQEASYIIDDELGYWVSLLSSKAVVVFLDSCHSGGHGRGVTPPGLSPRGSVGSVVRDILTHADTKPGRAILAACQPIETAWGIHGLKHGLFTNFLLEGMKNRTADQNHDGTVGFDELAAYVVREVGKGARQHSVLQNPVFENPSGSNITIVPSVETEFEGQRFTLRYMLHHEDEEFFHLLSERVDKILDLPVDEWFSFHVYEELLAQRPGNRRWFVLYELDTQEQIPMTLTRDYWEEGCIIDGKLVQIGPVLKIFDVRCGGAYKAIYDMSPHYPPLVEYWYVDGDGGVHRSIPQE